MNERRPDIKKAIEGIEVPHVKLDQTIASAMKKAKLKRKPYRKVYQALVAASFATCLLLGSAFVSPTMANVLSAVPVFDSVFEFAGDRGLIIASQRGLSERIEQTVTDQDIALTIKDVYYDGTRLSISYIQDSPSSRDRLGEMRLRIDGKEINFSDGQTGKRLSDTQYAGIISIEPIEELPRSFELQLGLSEIGDVAGTWDFEIPVTKSKEDIKTFKSNKTVIYEDTKITVKNVKVGVTGIKLSLTLTSPDGMDPNMIGDQLLQFNLLTDEGEALTQLASHGSGTTEHSENSMDMEYRFAPLEEESDTLTVSPFLVPVNSGTPQRLEQPIQKENLPITIDQGEMGQIIVEDIKYETDKTVLYFDVASDFHYDGHFQFNSLWLENNEGINLATTGYAERIERNSYVQEFKQVHVDEPLTLVSFNRPYIQVLKEEEIKIPLH